MLEFFDKIVWDEPPTRLTAIRRGTPYGLVAPWLAEASEGGTPGSKFAGGHRSRVTPVPIPNTEVKPATANGTAWETVWESRSLPALTPQGPTWLIMLGLLVFAAITT